MPKNIPLSPSVDLSSLRRFVRTEILPGALERDEQGEAPRHVFESLSRMGWVNSFFPEQYGGQGCSVVDLAFITRELAYGSAGVASSFLANCLGMGPIFRFGKPEVMERVAGECAKGPGLCSFGMTEADAGTDIAHLKTRARRVEGGYRIAGGKSYITNASWARHFVIFARCEDARGGLQPGLTAFYVPGDSPGLIRGKPLRKVGQVDSNTADLFLEDVFVPENFRLGEEQEGFKVAFHSLQRSKTLLGASSVGLCDRAFDLAEEYLCSHQRYGKPLLALSSIQGQLAQLHTEVQAGWLLTLHAAATWDTGALAIQEASMAKLFAADTAVKVANETVELMGGSGYLREGEIQKIYRDAKLLEIVEGASLVQQVLIAKELYGTRLKEAGQVIRRVA